MLWWAAGELSLNLSDSLEKLRKDILRHFHLTLAFKKGDVRLVLTVEISSAGAKQRMLLGKAL